MSEPEKKEGKIIIEIELPTKETVIKKLSELFPGIRVNIVNERKDENGSTTKKTET